MSLRMPSVVIVDENSARASIIEAGLRAAGHEQTSIIDDMNGVIAKIAAIEPDVVVIDLQNPNRDMLENAFQLSRTIKRPVAMFVDRSDNDTMQSAIDAGVSAYVVDGLRQDRVKSILDMAISRFNAYSKLERELEEAKSALESRKTIDQAKQILMSAHNISEDKAYKMLRTTAMNQNRKVVEVAESLILSANLLGN